MFYIGQRVKLVRPYWKEFYGYTGTIVGFGFWPKGMDHPNGGRLVADSNCIVDFDAWDDVCHSHTDRLEPIQKPPQPVIETTHWDDMPCDRSGKYREKETVT